MKVEGWLKIETHQLLINEKIDCRNLPKIGIIYTITDLINWSEIRQTYNERNESFNYKAADNFV